jgi:hypothetical protein
VAHTINPNPLPLNCPTCPLPMQYVGTLANEVHWYTCAQHGDWHLGPGGLFRPSEVRRILGISNLLARGGLGVTGHLN